MLLWCPLKFRHGSPDCKVLALTQKITPPPLGWKWLSQGHTKLRHTVCLPQRSLLTLFPVYITNTQAFWNKVCFVGEQTWKTETSSEAASGLFKASKSVTASRCWIRECGIVQHFSGVAQEPLLCDDRVSVTNTESWAPIQTYLIWISVGESWKSAFLSSFPTNSHAYPSENYGIVVNMSSTGQIPVPPLPR